MILKDKIAVVTGASDGLGKQIAVKLAKEGARLALVARNEERLNQVKSECISSGSPKVESYICDISNNDQVVETVKKIISDFETVDILLNIAGVWQKVGPLENISYEEIDDVINTNLKGVIYLTKELMPLLKKETETAIINVSSHSGIAAKQGQSVYSASKWGVTGFTQVLHEDLKGTNVRIAGVYQGGMHTDLFNKADDPKDAELFDKFTNPEDLADTIVFMLSRPPKIWLYDVRVEY